MGIDLLSSAVPTITYAPPEGIFNYIWVLIALPALGALILLVFGNRTNSWGHYLATILPIDKIIGRFYPIFGGLLIFMSVGLTIGLIFSDKTFFAATGGIENLFVNLHPKELPIWPLIFITIACGAISGFHSTQSPPSTPISKR